jgi:hypothetical protein
MRRQDWLGGFRTALEQSTKPGRRARKRRSTRLRQCHFESLEDRCLLAADFGDAPDIGLGSARGNYQTLLVDNGPSHTIVAGLHIGAHVDGDDGTLQNTAANADDVHSALPVDEDGLANPAADLIVTAGTQPTVNVWVTNTTGVGATLYGWIDYNADGVFDNATERASIAVPNNTSSTIATLSFPTVPHGLAGTTYARFRLSTDAAAANPTGAAADGEVEDYQAAITEVSSGIVASSKSRQIGTGTSGEPTLLDGAWFGGAVASLGDMDGDGVPDLAVGSTNNDFVQGIARGELYVLFMNSDGSVKDYQRISDGVGGGPALPPSNYFGLAIAAIGDLDGNGVTEIAVGDSLDSTANAGAAYVLFMNADGTVARSQKIASGVGGAPSLPGFGRFGSSVAALGDFDGDGVKDMLVGAPGDSTGGSGRGAAYLLLMNADGTVKSSMKIASGTGGGPTLADGDRFGSSVCTLGDLDGDGISELAVGAYGDDTGGSEAGAAYVLFMNSSGTVKSWQKIGNGPGSLVQLDRRDYFASSVAALGDLDGDGVNDLGVGATGDDTGATVFSNYGGRGAVYVLLLHEDGTVKENRSIANLTGGGPLLKNDDYFGDAVASLGDLDGDGVVDLVVGAPNSDVNGHGVVHLLPLEHTNHFAPQFTSPAAVSVVENLTGITTVTATDADVPSQAISFSIVGGTDRGAFEITTTGVLSFRSPKDFEAPTDTDRNNVYEVIVQASDGNGGMTSQTIGVMVTNVTDSPSLDFGDAPDSSAGTGPGNYNTLASDDGPRHGIVPGLRMGAYVDSDKGAQQNATANADDVNGAQPDDEDGLSNPAADLALTVGAQPSVNVWVTNTTGTGATLYGWIDYNADGIFDNATERASAGVPSGTISQTVTLVFPEVPSGFTGTTYARFRLSTGAAAANPTGAASDGEVEDYRATIVAPAIGQADSAKNKRITNNTNGGPALTERARFGRSVASIGDVDGDGIGDLVVGADYFDSGEGRGGAAYVLFMKADGTAKRSQKIASEIGGGPVLDYEGSFGIAVASLGDLDGDGIPDIAVGNSTDNLNGYRHGAIYILFLNNDGTVKRSQRIASQVGGAPEFYGSYQFGHSIAAIGDIDGDGVTELAVGTPGDGYAGIEDAGSVYVLFMNTDGTVKSSQKLESDSGGLPTLAEEELFGYAVASLGDFDGDGVNDLLVGAKGDDGSDTYRGQAYVVLLTPQGTAKSVQRISGDEGGGPPLSDYDGFGSSLASVGDLDGDGVTDIAVGARYDSQGEYSAAGYKRGAIYVLYLNADGTVKNRWKITDGMNGGPTLQNHSQFGSAVTALGDLDGDGIVDLAVGACGGYGDYGGDAYGSVHILFLNPVTPDYGDAPDTGPGNGRGNYATTAADNGPSHVIVAGLQLGATVDSDSGTLQNTGAAADNATGMMPSDEDGLVNPIADLQLTTGTTPSMGLWVTNQTGAEAMLYGWIDYNADGLFDNATERASIVVPDATKSDIFTLMFPVVPVGYTGTTYARFRLSTDPAAANSTGPASDGEVEDYRVQITAPSSGLADAAKTKKLARNTNGVPNQDIYLGGDFAPVGDLDGDGVADLVIASGYTLFMNPDGTVKSAQEIGQDVEGNHLAAVGDQDGDGIIDVAFSGVGRSGPLVMIVHMDANGTAKQVQSHAVELGIQSLAGIGDIDGDGIGDLAVGVDTERGLGDDYSGAVFVLLLNSDGSVKDGQIIGDEIGGGPQLARGDNFGTAVTSLGDIDGDGVPDLAAGAIGDDTGSSNDYSPVGAVYVLLMNPDGTAKSTHKIADQVGGGPTLDDYTSFGCSIASLGDLDGDGVTDIAVGALYDDTGGDGRGALHVLFLNADGSVKRTEKIADNTGGGPTLANWDHFGSSVTSLGDLDGDGITDIAVDAYGDDAGGSGDGAIYVLFLQPASQPSGDYNQNGASDASDYIFWRKTLGTTVTPHSGADGSGNGVVDAADFDVWRTSFGNSQAAKASGAALTDLAIELATPEPSAVADFVLHAAEQSTSNSSLDIHSKLPSAIATAIATSIRRQGTARKILQSNRPTLVAPSQDALLDWLRTTEEHARPDEPLATTRGLSSSQKIVHRSARLIDPIDLAFATLGI